jgi:calmodulin
MAQAGSISAETETLSHVSRLAKAFKAFDADNDGAITAAELGGIMGSLGNNPSEEEVRSMMLEGDTNKDGLLSIEEFLEMNTKDMELGSYAVFLKAATETLSTVDGDDALNGEELFEVMWNLGCGLTLEDCQNLVASMDGDGDGAVSFLDFKLIINSLL